MNPFDWTGPQFLLGYLVLILGAWLFCWLRTRKTDGPVATLGTDLTKDPYLIAYLRGGSDEAVRVAVFNLADRGFLEYKGGVLQVRRKDQLDALRRPLDQAIVKSCRETECSPAALLGKAAVINALEGYRAELAKRRMLPDGAEKARRMQLMWVAFAVLAGVAVIKIVVALARGYTNVLGLAFLMVVGLIIVAVTCHPRLTARGRQALDSLKVLVKRMKDNAGNLKPGGATNEALLLAAIAGLYALPAGAFDFVEEIYPKPQPAGGGDSGSGSDSGSSCSSSCGGGGGCGGCGG